MKNEAGAWVGLGVGDTDQTVADFKAFLKRKFTWVREHQPPVDDSPVFDQNFADVVSELQSRYGLPVTGIVDYALKVKSGFLDVTPELSGPVGTLFTVQGTGVDMWTGPPADTARAVLPDWRWQPIGNYPAAPFPMWPSIWQGVEELRKQIRDYANRFPGEPMALAGYSQGAIVTSWVYKWDIELEQGMLHDLLPLFKAGVTWGNPMRGLGAANGNRHAGWPVPEGRGIYKDRLERTPGWWFDYAHGANSQWGRDLYTDSPNDHTGDIETAVCDVVMMADPMTAFNMLFTHVGHLFDDPVTEIPPMFNAVVQAGMFFVVDHTMPHTDYDVNPAVDYLRGVAAGIRTSRNIRSVA